MRIGPLAKLDHDKSAHEYMQPIVYTTPQRGISCDGIIVEQGT